MMPQKPAVLTLKCILLGFLIVLMAYLVFGHANHPILFNPVFSPIPSSSLHLPTTIVDITHFHESSSEADRSFVIVAIFGHNPSIIS